MTRRLIYAGIAVVVALLLGTLYADAKTARCFTTDDGEYSCSFRTLDPDGSFEVSAPGRPTFSLWMEKPGQANGFLNFGDRNVALPGRYLREREDRACWHNADTETRICVW